MITRRDDPDFIVSIFGVRVRFILPTYGWIYVEWSRRKARRGLEGNGKTNDRKRWGIDIIRKNRQTSEKFLKVEISSRRYEKTSSHISSGSREVFRAES